MFSIYSEVTCLERKVRRFGAPCAATLPLPVSYITTPGCVGRSTSHTARTRTGASDVAMAWMVWAAALRSVTAQLPSVVVAR